MILIFILEVMLNFVNLYMIVNFSNKNFLVDTVRELLATVPATVKSDPPQGASLVGELGNESGNLN